jgi:hypothetical protein
MGSYSYAVWIEAPPQRAYDLYTDLDRIGEWQEGNPRITDISGDPGRAGSTYISRRGRFGSRFELMTAERPASQVVEFDGPMGLRAEMSSQFAPEEGGTKLAISLIARWRFPLIGRILELAIFNPRIAKRELGRLKALAEREER